MKILYILVFIILFTSCNKNSRDNIIDIKEEEPLFYEQWSIHNDNRFYIVNNIDEKAHINPQDVFSSYTGKGVKIAIIDNGFDINHLELKDKIIATISVDEDGNIGTDVSHNNSSEYHGTAVAGIIAASVNNIGIRGIAPNSKLILIKLPERFDDSVEIEIFKQAIKYGADVINCSWGTYRVSDTVKDYINEVSNTARDGKGVIFVFSSGNDDKLMGNDESAISSVIGVGATDKDNLRTSYSNYGNKLDIVAPGGERLGISTIDPSNNDGASYNSYNRYNQYNNGNSVSFVGTSASAPIITGVIALALEKNKNITRSELQEILKYSTDTIGRNTPYLDDMISSNNNFPTISGLLGTNINTNIKIKLISNETSTQYGLYSINLKENNTFDAIVTDELKEGNYTIQIVDLEDKMVWAEDDFEINYQGITSTNKKIKRSYFYGYGKINLDKFIKNIE